MNSLRLNFLIALLIVLIRPVLGQNAEIDLRNQIYFEGQLGISHLLKNNIDEKLNNAFNFGARFRFELAKTRLSIALRFN